MKPRSVGLILLILSLLLAGTVLANPEIYVSVEEFAQTDKGKKLEDKIVNVPPWNASEEPSPRGWVGFNVTLNYVGQRNYKANGVIIPADGDTEPKLVMRAVNVTGLNLLIFDSFADSAWNATKIYAAAFLDGERDQLFDEFRFNQLDNSSKYVLLFRGLKNETQDRPILISIKELFNKPTKLLEPQTSNILFGVSLVVAVVSIVLLTRKPKARARFSKKRPT